MVAHETCARGARMSQRKTLTMWIRECDFVTAVHSLQSLLLPPERLLTDRIIDALHLLACTSTPRNKG